MHCLEIFIHLSDSLVNELPLCSNQLFPVLSRFVEESRVDRGLLILHGDVASQDIGILQAFRHVRVARAMIED